MELYASRLLGAARVLIYLGSMWYNTESMTFGAMPTMSMPERKLVRVQEKGQVTLPADVRRKLGLKKGDLVAVTQTPDGVLITPQEVIAMKALDRLGNILREQGLSLDELIQSGREIRGRMVKDKYGIGTDQEE